ncbi:MAG: hypothetical protein GEU91_00065 [Rhizobiales bacterium]|nr:hypothetical protein [Hyphomicrobiales bacterium]
MRSLLAALSVAAAFSAASAHAEKRMFVIGNNADGYGIDRCLASGAACGFAMATAYCHSREFTQALSFRKVDRDEITGAVPTGGSGECTAGSCTDFVAIECGR